MFLKRKIKAEFSTDLKKGLEFGNTHGHFSMYQVQWSVIQFEFNLKVKGVKHWGGGGITRLNSFVNAILI